MLTHHDVNNQRNHRHHTPPSNPIDDSRTPARKDRDRIIYTSAFRRLVYVTQVASPDQAHVFHNRLTHSLQVAQVGRAVAEKLVLANSRKKGARSEIDFINPDVVEAACLAHDLGHPPFGHTAEEELNRLAKGAVGGFEGNAQSFRIVTKLAFKSDKYDGLDLTRATLAATLKYPWLKGENTKKPKKWGAYKSEIGDFKFARKLRPAGKFKPTAEAQLMDWADDVTYSVHDMEDFYRAGRIPMHVLARSGDNSERRRFFDDVYRRRGNDRNFYPRPELEEVFGSLMAAYWRMNEPYSGLRDQRSKLRYCTSNLIHRYITNVELDQASQSIKIDDEFRKEVAILKELTWTYVIEGPALAMQREGQKKIISVLFNAYTEASESPDKWSLFPPYYRYQLKQSASAGSRKRVVIDLIAGMTEPQAVATYAQLMGLQPAVTLEEIVRQLRNVLPRGGNFLSQIAQWLLEHKTTLMRDQIREFYEQPTCVTTDEHPARMRGEIVQSCLFLSPFPQIREGIQGWDDPSPIFKVGGTSLWGNGFNLGATDLHGIYRMPHARQLIIVIPAEIWVGVENMKRKKKITGKQITRTLTRRERALLEYIRSGKTITDAARQAGFSTKWPGQAGSQAFRNIQRKMPTLLDELGMTLESIVRQVEKDLENEEKEEIEIIEI